MNAAHNWDMLITGLNLATMAGNGPGIIKGGALGIADGRIAWIGPERELPPHTAKETHDAEGAWATPGLIDCHTHLVYAGNRSDEFAARMGGTSYEEIARKGGGILSTVRAVREASEDALYYQSEKRLKALLREGVTTVEIKSGYGLDLENERKMLRVARALGEHYSVTVRTTFLGAHALPPEFAGDADAYITYLCMKMLPALVAEGLVDAVDGFCESIGFTVAQMARVFESATALGLPVKLHAEQLSDQGGAGLAAMYHALSADHLEHASEESIRAMAEAGTAAVLLPGAYYLLRENRKPPVELLRKHGVPMALATDCNPGTSPVTSLLLMLNMGCVLFGLTPAEALAGATRNGAYALGLQEELGTLEVGKIADIAFWDIGNPVELVSQPGYNPCIGVLKEGKYIT